MIHPNAIANAFLDLAWEDNTTVCNMKLQKLVYFAHGWYLVHTHKPLIDKVEAIHYGILIRDVLEEFRHWNLNPIEDKAYYIKHTNNGELKKVKHKVTDPVALDIIKEVWEAYGKYTRVQLANITHREGTPWHKLTRECPYEVFRDKNVTIPHELIRNYFMTRLEGNNTEYDPDWKASKLW